MSSYNPNFDNEYEKDINSDLNAFHENSKSKKVNTTSVNDSIDDILGLLQGKLDVSTSAINKSNESTTEVLTSLNETIKNNESIKEAIVKVSDTQKQVTENLNKISEDLVKSSENISSTNDEVVSKVKTNNKVKKERNKIINTEQTVEELPIESSNSDNGIIYDNNTVETSDLSEINIEIPEELISRDNRVNKKTRIRLKTPNVDKVDDSDSYNNKQHENDIKTENYLKNIASSTKKSADNVIDSNTLLKKLSSRLQQNNKDIVNLYRGEVSGAGDTKIGRGIAGLSNIEQSIDKNAGALNIIKGVAGIGSGVFGMIEAFRNRETKQQKSIKLDTDELNRKSMEYSARERLLNKAKNSGNEEDITKHSEILEKLKESINSLANKLSGSVSSEYINSTSKSNSVFKGLTSEQKELLINDNKELIKESLIKSSGINQTLQNNENYITNNTQSIGTQLGGKVSNDNRYVSNISNNNNVFMDVKQDSEYMKFLKTSEYNTYEYRKDVREYQDAHRKFFEDYHTKNKENLDGISVGNSGGMIGNIMTTISTLMGGGLLKKIFNKNSTKNALKVASTTSKVVANPTTAKVGTKVASAIAKGGAKSLVKKIPVVGAIAGLGFGAYRAMQGDYTGAGLEVASGAASLIPGIGTAASLGIDAGLMVRDINRSKSNNKNEQEYLKMNTSNSSIINQPYSESILNSPQQNSVEYNTSQFNKSSSIDSINYTLLGEKIAEASFRRWTSPSSKQQLADIANIFGSKINEQLLA